MRQKKGGLWEGHDRERIGKEIIDFIIMLEDVKIDVYYFR